jgi:hypothetical protein
MPTSDVKPGEKAKDVRFTEDTLSVDLVDGRTITVPLVWYPRLLHATPEQRKHWRVCGGGYGIHWPDIDEDLSTDGLLRGGACSTQPHRGRARPTGCACLSPAQTDRARQ